MFSFALCVFLNWAFFSEGVVQYVIVVGEEANVGYVDIFNGSDWYSLCYDGWDEEDAAVVCRMLGYSGDGALALYIHNNVTRRAIWDQKLECNGNESSLLECQASEANSSCVTSAPAIVSCSKVPFPDDFFLIAFGFAITRIDRSSLSLTVITTQVQNAVALRYDDTLDMVIWTDNGANQIARCDINGGQVTVIYQARNESVMDGIAVDSIARLLFYTDTGFVEIGVIDADTFERNVIIDTGLSAPKDIIVDVETREIFWTDLGENASIERASYDGSGREILVNTELVVPNAIVLDGDYLYWADASTGRFERMHRNGTDRITIAFLGQCFGLTEFGPYLYCNDWNYANLVQISKNGSGAFFIGPGLVRRYGIHHYKKGPVQYLLVAGDKANKGYVDVYNGSDWNSLCYEGWDDDDAAVVCRMLGYTGTEAQALYAENSIQRHDIWGQRLDCSGSETSLKYCQTSETNSACNTSSLAVVSCSTEYLPCAVSFEMVLADQEPDDFFLLSFGSEIARMDRVSMSISIIQTQVQRVIALGYDDRRNMVIWTDITANQIAQCDINGGIVTVIYQAGSESVMDGIAVDGGSRLIFYTDTGYDEIAVIDADTFTRTVIIDTNLEEPRGITFDSKTREIFWTDWGTNPAIEKASYDGSGREVLVDVGLIWPNSVVLHGDFLYWCDAQTDVFEKMHRNGTGRTSIVNTTQGHCFDFTIFGQFLYSNDWSYGQILRLQKDGKSASFIGPSLNRRYGIHHFKSDYIGHQTSNVRYDYRHA